MRRGGCARASRRVTPSNLLPLGLFWMALLCVHSARADSASLIAETRAGSAPDPSKIEVMEHLGAQLPLSLPLLGQDGRPVRLGDFLSSDKPTVMVLAYYHCPMLCGLVLQSVARALDSLNEFDLQPGDDFRLLTISFDPQDNHITAQRKQMAVLGGARRRIEQADWPFVTAEEPAIATLSSTLGFALQKDSITGQFVHPAVIFVLTPEGRIARYLYGIEYSARDLKLAVLEAGRGQVGSTFDRILVRCYAYDPAARRYRSLIDRFMRVGASGILLVLGTAMVVLWRRDRRRFAAPRTSSNEGPRHG